MTRVLVVTNDFPPDHGGIQRFAHELVRALAADLPDASVVVHASRARDEASQGRLDADLARAGVVVVRDPRRLLLPTCGVAARVVATARRHGCDSVWFVAGAPLGLLAGRLRAAGVRTVVASTHGHEVWWARVPVTRALLRRVAAGADVLTHVSAATRDAVTPVVAAASPPPHRVRLAPGVDAATFAPAHATAAVGVDRAAVRARHGLAGRPVVVCVSRLVARKGAARLVVAMPAIRALAPGAALLLVGDGPARRSVLRAARRAGLAVGHGGDVVLTGAVEPAELAAHYAAGDVFAMPATDRRGGLETEGLGICYLEAAACGLPVVAGRSGGTPEALLDGVTGMLVDGRDTGAIAAAVGGLLADPARAAAMGRAGRAWVVREWGWPARAAVLAALLATGPRGADSLSHHLPDEAAGAGEDGHGLPDAGRRGPAGAADAGARRDRRRRGLPPVGVGDH